MPTNSLQDLYLTKLQLIYDAELQALESYPKLVETIQHTELKQAFQTHMDQTRDQVQQLEQLFASNGLQGGQRGQCVSMRALIQEAQQMLPQIQDAATRDAFLIGAAQAMEHLEISSYGTARTWAQQLGRDQDAQVLERILQQEEQTDKLLTRIAEGLVNRDAARGDREVSRGAESEMGSSSGFGGTSGGSLDVGSESRM
jgi:ferritin-like metal-binding protein YciE